MLTGCGTPPTKVQVGIDQFLDYAKSANPQFSKCVRSTSVGYHRPVQVDGFFEFCGAMVCGQELTEQVIKNNVTFCEATCKSPCHQLAVLDRSTAGKPYSGQDLRYWRDEVVAWQNAYFLAIEQKAKLAEAEKQQEENERRAKICDGFGLSRESPEHPRCVEKIYFHETEMAQRQKEFELTKEKTARELQLKEQALEQQKFNDYMSRLAPARNDSLPKKIVCNSNELTHAVTCTTY